MGEYFIIAAGGTGAMCASSFIYMAAAGCADNTSTYHILLMDKDKESDSMTLCHNLLKNYFAMRDQMGKKSGTFTFPKIVLHEWNFTDEIIDEYQLQTGGNATDLENLTLNKLLNPRNDPSIGQLLDTMYSTEELDTDLKMGFYGHPNIGAPVFDYVRDRFLAVQVKRADGTVRKNSFMASLHDSLNKGKTFVYLFGSLFGGTGATIIPNVARALRTLKDPGHPNICYGKTNLILGGTVVMPYFRLPNCPVDSLEALAKVSPVDTKFADQTKEALTYYHESHLLSDMMNLLLVGTSQLDVTSEMYSRGGAQNQHFHIVHMLAATAANRFFAASLGGMAKAITGDTVQPLGELLMWKMVPNDPGNNGNFHTLIPQELGLDNEYAHMTAFLRFSVVVAYYMRLKFEKDSNELKQGVEVLGTYKQMTKLDKPLTMKDLDQNTVNLYYQEPVKKAGAICRGFIKYLFDISLSGFDWSKYREKVHSNKGSVKVGDKTYFDYELGAVDRSAASFFTDRWVDFANLAELQSLVESASLSHIVDNKTLNEILSYQMLDEDRTAYLENRFPNSIAQVYEEKTLGALGLRKGLISSVKNDRVYFCEIYDELYKQCQCK